MKRVLVAVGEVGNHGQSWNWCDQDEVVGVHGSVCGGACSCGCGRSFSGIDSLKATTQAVVREVSDEQFGEIQERLVTNYQKAWAGSLAIGGAARESFSKLARVLEYWPVGATLTVDKDDDGIGLRKV